MGVYETKDVTPEKISRLMVGRDVVLQVQKDVAKPTDEILRVRDLHYAVSYTHLHQSKVLTRLFCRNNLCKVGA